METTIQQRINFNKMKKYVLILAMFVGFTMSGVGQEDDKKDGGRIEALKIAFLTRKLNLTTDEAQKFWPIYNKYADELRKAQLESRQNKVSEIERDEKILNIRKRFNGEFAKALSTEKVNAFFRVEREFNGFLQKEMMERRQNRIDRNRLRNN
jgi:hypothetical protein